MCAFNYRARLGDRGDELDPGVVFQNIIKIKGSETYVDFSQLSQCPAELWLLNTNW